MGAKGSISRLPPRISFIKKKTYEDFIKETGSEISYENWALLIKTFNLNLRHAVLHNPFGFELPCQLGVIAVDKFKGKHTLINYAASKVEGKMVPFLNLHCLGYRFKIRWYKFRVAFFKFQGIYHFDGCREMDRELAAIIKSGNYNYENVKPQSVREKIRLKKFVNTRWA